jgi:hypothetical protein
MHFPYVWDRLPSNTDPYSTKDAGWLSARPKTGSDEAVRDVAWNVIRTPDAAGPLKSYRRLQSANDANQLCPVGAVDWLVLAGLPRELNWSPGAG